MASRKPTVMVIGSTGMLGAALVRHLSSRGHSLRPVSRGEFVIGRDPVSALDLAGVDCVVNAAGLINRRLVEGANEADAWLVNSLFPRLLADHCEARGVRAIHVSTDCVFDGTAGPYVETDPPTATDLYGRSKAWGEPRNCLVIRTSIFGPELRNFYLLLSWFLAQTDECRGFTNHLWNGMTTLQLARCVETILDKDLHENRVQHLFSEDTTKYDLLCAMAKAFSRPVRVIPFEDARRRDTRLRTIHPELPQQLGIASLEEQLRDLVPFAEALRHG
jgi:dTDP-4-dehydrorhamnose reductase